METNYRMVDTLEKIFRDSWVRLDSVPRSHEVWVEQMNSHDVTILTHEDLLSSFADMVNFGALVKTNLCVTNPSEEDSFLLVPPELVEKCLVMGALA